LGPGNCAEESSDLFPSAPRSGKRHVFHFGQLPLNIFAQRIQERLKVARLDALISLSHQARVCLFVHGFSPCTLRGKRLFSLP
jgi:hypothetical protein